VAGKWRLAIYICYIQSLNLIYFIIQVPWFQRFPMCRSLRPMRLQRSLSRQIFPP
jgi:hypothetical protein